MNRPARRPNPAPYLALSVLALGVWVALHLTPQQGQALALIPTVGVLVAAALTATHRLTARRAPAAPTHCSQPTAAPAESRRAG